MHVFFWGMDSFLVVGRGRGSPLVRTACFARLRGAESHASLRPHPRLRYACLGLERGRLFEALALPIGFSLIGCSFGVKEAASSRLLQVQIADSSGKFTTYNYILSGQTFL